MPIVVIVSSKIKHKFNSFILHLFYLKNSSPYILLLIACLNTVLLSAKAETLQQLYDKAQQTEQSSPDSAAAFLQKIVTTEKYLKENPELTGKSLRKLALLTSLQQENESIELCEKAIGIFKSLKNHKETGITYNTIANIYQRKGYFDLAIRHYQKAACNL
jgi:tetratricopeptide (TPR) repeat protein